MSYFEDLFGTKLVELSEPFIFIEFDDIIRHAHFFTFMLFSRTILPARMLLSSPNASSHYFFCFY